MQKDASSDIPAQTSKRYSLNLRSSRRSKRSKETRVLPQLGVNDKLQTDTCSTTASSDTFSSCSTTASTDTPATLSSSLPPHRVSSLPASLLFTKEQTLYQQKHLDLVIGVDEVGRGCLAGPVVICACYIDKEMVPECQGIQDSKSLDEAQREYVYNKLETSPGVSFKIAQRSAESIDTSNILAETMDAMATAVESLLEHLVSCRPNVHEPLRCHVLVDGNRVPPRLAQKKTRVISETSIILSCEPCIQGDAHIFSIATASIIAKTLSNMCRQLNAEALKHPNYGFERHKGYATVDHLEAIRKHGVLAFHRLTFKPICSLLLSKDLYWPEGRAIILLDPVQRRLQQRKKRMAASSTSIITYFTPKTETPLGAVDLLTSSSATA